MSDSFDHPLDARLRKRWRDRMRIWRQENKMSDDPLLGVPPVEDFLPAERPKPTGFELLPEPGSAWVSNVMIALSAMCSVLHWTRAKSLLEISPFVATKNAVFEGGEVWRLLTALAGHGDVMHLLHNAPILWFFAWILNAYFGWMVTLVGGLLIGVLSNAMTIWFYDSHVQLLGASGMVYGLVALWLTLYIRFDQKSWWVKRVMRSLGFSMLVLFPQTYEANVSYLAHATGFGLGIAVGLIFMPYLKNNAPVFVDPYYRGLS